MDARNASTGSCSSVAMDDEISRGSPAHVDEEPRAASPSTLSTASSGSPLIRSHSGASAGAAAKRPAPTSIAAAQLQCQQQQQQQLEFNNKMAAKGSKQVARANKLLANSGAHQQVAAGEYPRKQQSYSPRASYLSSSSSSTSLSASSASLASASATTKQQKSAKCHEENKGFGYNVAKSLAFRAYRFNEFWSANKLRYMNLVCLLMTLVCLVTILLFSGNNSAPQTEAPSASFRLQQRGNIELLSKRLTPIEPTIESMESIDSQPLTRNLRAQQSAAAAPTTTTSASNGNENLAFDDSASESMEPSTKVVGSSSNNKRNSSGESLVNDFITSGKPQQVDPLERESESESKGKKQRVGDSSISMSMEFDSPSHPQAAMMMPPPPPFLAPILSQIFQDMDMSPIFKSLKNGSISASSGGRPTVIRRHGKDGSATIIISSSTNAIDDPSSLLLNETSGQPHLPLLLEKLLPPMLRKSIAMLNPRQQHSGNDTSQGTSGSGLSGTATITIGAEPLFAADSFGSILSPMRPFEASSRHHNHQQSSYLEPFGGSAQSSPRPLPFLAFGHPFGQSSFMMGPPPAMMSPGGIMSMMMRANSMQDPDSSESMPDFPMSQLFSVLPTSARPKHNNDSSETQNSTTTSGGSNTNSTATTSSSNKTTDTLSAQASQQNSTTISQNPTNASSVADPEADKSTSSSSFLDSEVETFDISHLPRGQMQQPPPLVRMHNLYGLRPRLSPLAHGGSMLVFSTSGVGGFDPTSRATPFFPPPSGFMGPMLPPFLAPSFMSASHPSAASQPQVVFTSGGDASDPMMGSVVRSMLGNVVTELAAAKTEASKSERSAAQRRLDAKAAAGAGSQDSSSWADMDDEWAADDEPSIVTAKQQLRARHRSSANEDQLSEMNDYNQAEAAEFVTGIQIDHSGNSMDSPTAHMIASGSDGSPVAGGMISGTIRRTIRGPGVTVERIIEIPARAAAAASVDQPQQVGAGIKSQSLSSRSDFDGSESPSSFGEQRAAINHLFPHPFHGSRLFAVNNRELSGADFPPVGLIGRLLSDLSRRVADSPATAIKNRSASPSASEDDFERANGMEDSPITFKLQSAPRIRVASAKIRMRPLEMPATISSRSSSSPSGIFMPPTHFTIPIQDHGDSSEKIDSKLASSLEDTLNSVEDRLNNVMSMASSSPIGSNHRMSEADQPTSKQPQQHLFGGLDQQASQLKPDESPFTSPTSPLFGFPLQSTASRGLQQQQPQSPSGKTVDDTSNNQNQQNSEDQTKQNVMVGDAIYQSNRKPRSFAYHSNYEVANPSVGSEAQRRYDSGSIEQPLQHIHHNHNAQHQTMNVEARARMVEPLLPPPADIIMGRRADDSPVEALESSNHQRSIRSSEASDRLEDDDDGDNDDSNYKTIVV